MVSIFKTLGDIITRHPWVFIALWLLILVASLPLVNTFNSNLQYNTQQFTPDNLEANLASNVYNAQFPGSISSNQIIVVVSAANNTTSMNFIDALDSAITGDRNIPDVTGTSSIYSLQRIALVNMTRGLYNTLYAAYGNASNGSQMTGYTIKNDVVSQALSNMNLTTNDSFLLALLDLPRNLTDDQLKAFAVAWADNHSYNDPRILPDPVVNSLASGNLTLYIISAGNNESSTSSTETINLIRDHVTQLTSSGLYPGVQAYVTGASVMSLDASTSSSNTIGITILLVLVLLFIYFRSFLTPFVPILIIIVAIVACFGLMGIISTYMSIYSGAQIIMIVVMLGAGTDYCVFMLSRYVEERAKGNDRKGSVRMAVEHAGKSIASSGLAAIIGFGALILIPSGIFQSIGLGCDVSILLSVLAALTLIPAVLTIAGDRLFWPRKRYSPGPSRSGQIWKNITGHAIKHPMAIIAIALIITVPMVAIFTQLQLSNDPVSMVPDGPSKDGYNLLDSQFGSSTIGTAMIVATLPIDIRDASGNFSSDALGRIENLSSAVAVVPGVAAVYSATRPDGSTIDYNNLSVYNGLSEEYYRSYMNNSTGIDDRTTVLYVAFNGSPDSAQSDHTTDVIQNTLKQYNATNHGTALLLGGSGVETYEFQTLCTNYYALVIPVVLIGIFIVLLLLLRSIFTPARLVLTLLMSISWTIGVFILVFQDWMQASIYWILPILLFSVLMGLGIDYDIFLVSRIREEAQKGRTNEEAILQAVESTGTIITICGLVMASAFGSLMIANLIFLREFGFVLFLAILVDATVMRLIIVPSIMVVMKKYNWWMPFAKNKTE